MWINLEDIKPSERTQTQRAYIVGFHLCELSEISRFIQTELQIGGYQGLGEGENGEKLLSEYEILFWCDRNVLELERCYSSITP